MCEAVEKYAEDEKILLLAELIEKGRLVIQDAVSSLGISPEEFEKRVKELRSEN